MQIVYNEGTKIVRYKKGRTKLPDTSQNSCVSHPGIGNPGIFFYSCIDVLPFSKRLCNDSSVFCASAIAVKSMCFDSIASIRDRKSGTTLFLPVM